MPRGIFCIETVWFEVDDYTSVRPMLQMLRDSFLEVPFIHRIAQTREEFFLNINQWKGLNAYQFPILYICYHGDDGCIQFANEDEMTVADICAELGNNCTYRLVHFASCSTLNPNEEAIGDFLDVTNCSAVSGYAELVDWMPSMAVDLLFLECLQNENGFQLTTERVRESCAGLLDDSPAANFCENVGFRLFTP